MIGVFIRMHMGPALWRSLFVPPQCGQNPCLSMHVLAIQLSIFVLHSTGPFLPINSTIAYPLAGGQCLRLILGCTCKVSFKVDLWELGCGVPQSRSIWMPNCAEDNKRHGNSLCKEWDSSGSRRYSCNCVLVSVHVGYSLTLHSTDALCGVQLLQ